MLEQEAQLRIRGAFPAVMRPDVDVALLHLDGIYEDPAVSVSTNCIGPIQLHGEQLRIPYRVYLSEPKAAGISALTAQQHVVLNAILSRSSNGFLREKCVSKLVHSDEPWIPPFVLQLLGEYVLPIIRVVEDHSAILQRAEYRGFVLENPAFLQLLRQRVISYWNCYYRDEFPRLADYPAFGIIESFSSFDR